MGVGCWTMPNHDRWVWNWWKSWSIVSTSRSAAWCFHLWEFGKVCWWASAEAVVVITINRTFNDLLLLPQECIFPSLTVTHVTFHNCKNVFIEDSCLSCFPKGAMLHICKNKSSGIWFSITCKWPFYMDYMAPIGTAAQGGSASICHFVQRSGITAVPFTSMSTWQTFYPALNVKQKDVIIV